MLGVNGVALLQNNQKFVPTDPEYLLAVSNELTQSLTYFLDQQIPNIVTQRIVDRLKLVQIQKQNRNLLCLGIRLEESIHFIAIRQSVIVS